MKLDFNFQLPGLDGKEMPGEANNAGKLLSALLASQNKGNSIKLYDWALKVYNNTPLEIDDTDADVLSTLIETSEAITIMGKVPLINYIKSVKEGK
jgi:hypothetical protein